MNATSSRAHTIVTINFNQKSEVLHPAAPSLPLPCLRRILAMPLMTALADAVQNAEGQNMTKTSNINLVDLAGSERADSTGALHLLK